MFSRLRWQRLLQLLIRYTSLPIIGVHSAARVACDLTIHLENLDHQSCARRWVRYPSTVLHYHGCAVRVPVVAIRTTRYEKTLSCHCATVFESISTLGPLDNVDHPCTTLSITSRILNTAIIDNSQPWLAQPYRENRSIRTRVWGGQRQNILQDRGPFFTSGGRCLAPSNKA